MKDKPIMEAIKCLYQLPLSTHVFYDPTTDTHIVLNFGSTSKMVPSFQALIDVVSVLKRVQS